MKPVRQIGNNVLPSLPPRPNMPQFPSFNLATESLPAHNASLQPFMQGAGPRPSGDFMPNIPQVRVPEAKIGFENFVPKLAFNRGVQESFGGSPKFEAEQSWHRPTNPRAIFKNAPKITMKAETKKIPMMEKTVLPKANLPNIPNFAKMVSAPSPMTVEARPVLPPIRKADLGGPLASTSKFGGIGNSQGRTFGSESYLF
jgi:hypothetical protein